MALHTVGQALVAAVLAWLGPALPGCGTRVLDVVDEPPVRPPSDAAIEDAAADASQGPVELCNGRDDDDNGRIDDLDARGDGLCDCLRVRVLGSPRVSAEAHALDSWLPSRGAAAPIRFGNGKLDAESLTNVDVLVVEDLSTLGRVFGLDEGQVLDTFLRAGGGVWVLAGFGTAVENANVMLAPYGAGFDPPDPLAERGLERVVDAWADHPIARGLGKIIVIDAQPTRGLGTQLARSGSVEVARVLSVGSGRVLMWGDDFVTDYAAWRARTDLDIERLWLNALAWLTPVSRCQLEAR